MPNLMQIDALRQKYASNNNVSIREIRLLSENFRKPVYEIKNSFSRSGVSSNLISYFENQESAQLVLLFIDITGFSQKCKNYSNTELSRYLDAYYEKVISLVYYHGGEIEKIIGDGIICLFGKPFLEGSKRTLFEKADVCAKDIIAELKNSDKEVKIAMHDGEIMYYKNKTESYPEYTVIGKPMTELFRLESAAESNSVSFYYVSEYDSMSCTNEGVYKISQKNNHAYWKKSGLVPVTLKGVDWSYIKNFTCTHRS